MESDISTSIYSDNMAKAIAQGGRVIVSMIPQVYDARRAVQILGKDKTPQIVTINDAVMSQNGMQPVNDVRIGRYDVRVTVGPNYTTRRQETAESMIDFVRAFPPAAGVTADLVAQNMDWPGADQFAERLKKLLPPGIADSDEPPSPQQMAMMQRQMQMQQMQEQMAMQRAQAETMQADAEAREASADAEKARLEVADQSMELAMKSGQINAAIAQIVQQEVARALRSVMVPQAPQPPQMRGF